MKPTCLWSLVTLLALPLGSYPQTFSSAPPPQHLSLGQKPGTFTFSYSGQVQFTQEPAFPVTVSITDLLRKPLTQIQVKDGAPFTITADLPPGSYGITSNVAPEKSKVYWEALGQRFFIDQKGLVTCMPGNGPLVHRKMMTVLSPDPRGLETITEARPLLKWMPLEGAVRYNIFWLVEEPDEKIDRDKNGHSGDINTTEYRLPEDVIPNRRYEWSVMAFGPNNEWLGYWSAAYFFTPGGREAFKKSSPPTSPKAGVPYLGIDPMPRPIHSGFSPTGIGVMGLVPNSPALKAGLLPNDVLTSFNGQSLEEISREEFIHMVHQVPVGTNVTIEFQRDGVKKSVQVTLAAKP